MTYDFRPLGWGEALRVARWRYPPPYELYDLARGPLLASVALHRVLAPLGRLGFFSAHAPAQSLVGLFSFRVSARTVELGLALRPDLTGQRLGLEFVQAGMDFARDTYAPRRFRLDVAIFNRRAIQVYTRAGFVPGRRFTRYTRLGLQEFMEMTRPA